MGVYVPGTTGVVVFYASVLAVGVWAAATRRKKHRPGQDDLIIASRGLGLVLGAFSLTATWVGGAFVTHTAENVNAVGLIGCRLPICYSLSLLLGAMLFAKPMRKAEYVTMLDPFQQHYGAKVGGLLFLPALFGDLLWSGVVLKGLGNFLSVVAGLDPNVSVVVSASLVAIYTVFGGLHSVAYTDALQLAFFIIGLAVATPYAMLNPAVSFEKYGLRKNPLVGDIKIGYLAMWTDSTLILIFGSIPSQTYFQRILSIKDTAVVSTMSIAAMIGCLAIALPSAMIGVTAKVTDWSQIQGFDEKILVDNGILPIILRYLTPTWVAFIVLGTISAGFMSSADSSILASSSMFSRNIYRLAIRPKASERELVWILRISVIIMSLLSACVALTIDNVYFLLFLGMDLVYVILFPQLLAVIHWPSMVDTYGCLAGYVVAVFLRIAAGDRDLGIPVFIHYPYFDRETETQVFPFRTSAMLTALLTQLLVSFITRNLLGKGYCPRCCDPLGVYSPGKSKEQSGVVQSSSGAALIDTTLNDTSTCRSSGTPDNDSMGYISRSSDGGDHFQCVEEHETNYRGGVGGSAVHRANRSLQNLQNLQNSIHTPGKTRPSVPPTPIVNSDGQILGVRNLQNTMGPIHVPEMNGISVPLRIVTPKPTTGSVSLMGTPAYGKLSNIEKAREIDRIVDRSALELNLNINSQENHAVVKKSVMGVKLIGMDGGTLRRPSLQGTFSPTPSVELVNILDRRQSGGSYGPSSLSPVPGVEACKTHGTAIGGQTGNEHCRIKRGIVRHHSFNDTGDRALTTLARQPNYPSMPLRPEDCRLTLMKKDKKCNGVIARHSSVADEKGLCGRGLVLSPTYSMYGSAVKGSNYFVADDEAVSRF